MSSLVFASTFRLISVELVELKIFICLHHANSTCISGSCREATMRAPPSGTVNCLFQQLFAKNYPRTTLRKLWNVIVGCHDCNCSLHLSKFSAVDARSPKKGQHCLFPHGFEQCLLLTVLRMLCLYYVHYACTEYAMPTAILVLCIVVYYAYIMSTMPVLCLFITTLRPTLLKILKVRNY